MAGDAVGQTTTDEGPLSNPWPFLTAGLWASALAAVLHGVAPLSPTVDAILLGVRLVLFGAGLLAAAGGVVIRPGEPAVLGAAAGATFLARLALNGEWDTIRLLLGLMTALALAAALLMLLPRVVRRGVVSVVILFHFAGILVAVLSVAPPSGQGSWLVGQVWTRVYRPYLQFMYLNNAYHFYSPEPGPATLLWFRVEYADGTARRTKIIDRDLYPLDLEYQRRLSLTESTNQLEPPPAVMTQALQRLQQNRLSAGLAAGGIPPHPEILITLQYRLPNLFSRKMIESYARYVARTTPHPTDPTQPVTGVKIYRVVHRILGADELSRGLHPLDPTTYLAYYQGDFEPDGKLKETCMKTGWTDSGYDVLEQDPYLYWLIPILREPPPSQQSPEPQTFRVRVGDQRPPPAKAKDLPVTNYVKIHAGDKDDGGDEW
jgi:hypothetical protein